MKCLYTNGDSWTYGTEIPIIDGYDEKSSKYYNTWPWFLSQNLAIPVCVNEAAGGGSNIRIFRKTNNFINNWLGQNKDPKNLTIVIGWTTAERTEIADNNNIYSVKIDNVINYRKNNVDKQILEYQKIFYQLYSEEYGDYMTVLYMINLRNVCINLGIKYYDFIAIGKEIKMWQQMVKNYWNLEINNMYMNNTWIGEVVHNQWPQYQHGHPTVETHKIWADILTKNIK